LAHPGGNVTGLSFAGEETVGRELQLLKAMVPDAGRVAVLANPTAKSADPIISALQRAAASVQTEIVVGKATAPPEIDTAFNALKQQQPNGLIVLGNGLFTAERKRLIALAARDRLPTIYHDHVCVEDGGLMSYGGDFADNYRGAANLVDKILKGAKPADLPVQEPAKFYLYLNRKTAEALGLTIPSLLEIQADRIIE
jgi:putative ABC transport system substrate-binding protein